MPGADFCPQAQMKHGLLAFRGERFKIPACIGCFAMDWMLLAAITKLISTEGQAEKITSQSFDDGR